VSDGERLGVGIVGAGTIADAHADAYLAAGMPVVAVMSAHRSSAERLARRVGATHATDRLADLLADPLVVAVDVCTPTADHAASTIAAARAGKHVHVEKPIALTLQDADAAIAACREAGVMLMVGQTARYHAVARGLQAAVDSGDLGRPFHLELSWDHGTFWPGGWRGWHVDRAQSGGHLVHNGVHAFDLASWLLAARPVRVYAQARAVAHPELASHDYWQAHVTYADGQTALCEVGYVLRATGAAHRVASLYGTRGSAFHTTLEDGVLYADGGAQPLGLTGVPAMRAQIADWVGCLRNGGGEPPVTGHDGRLALAVGLAAERSVELGRPVQVQP
jgi:predicted dehydrogenase